MYIKDIKPNPPPQPVVQQNSEISSSTNITPTTLLSTTQSLPQNIIQINKGNTHQSVEVPFYTLQLPTIVSNSNIIAKTPKDLTENKITQLSHNQLACSMNLLNSANIRTSLPKNEILNNVVVNSNGEVINIAHVGDFETLLNQSGTNMIKTRHKSSKRTKELRVENNIQDTVVKIDLTDTDVSPIYDLDHSNLKYEKLPHIKSINQNKYTYSFKLEEKNQNSTVNSTVIYPNSEYNQNFNNNFSASNTMYTQSNVNVVNTTTSHANVTNNTTLANLDVNSLNINSLRNVENSLAINVLNHNLQEVPHSYTNVIPGISSNIFNNAGDNPDNKINTQITDNNSGAPHSQLKAYVCDVCSRGFKRREHLYQHVKLHTGFRPYRCDHCNKAFMRKEHLIRHSTLHSGQKNYTCNICEKSFSRNDNLLKHKKTHDKQTSYTCEICQKQFVMKHYYNAHKLAHGDKSFVSAVWNMLKT